MSEMSRPGRLNVKPVYIVVPASDDEFADISVPGSFS